jgi:cell volume regulation protein A
LLALINISADSSSLNQVVLLFGASYILFDGGASLRFEVCPDKTKRHQTKQRR